MREMLAAVDPVSVRLRSRHRLIRRKYRVKVSLFHVEYGYSHASMLLCANALGCTASRDLIIVGILTAMTN